eukprot:COSAG02_NODE_1149_length_14210_cov_40.850542_3_plen_296_part_00
MWECPNVWTTFVTELCVLRTFGSVNFSLVFICGQSVSEFLWERLPASIQFQLITKRAQYARFSGERVRPYIHCISTVAPPDFHELCPVLCLKYALPIYKTTVRIFNAEKRGTVAGWRRRGGSSSSSGSGKRYAVVTHRQPVRSVGGGGVSSVPVWGALTVVVTHPAVTGRVGTPPPAADVEVVGACGAGCRRSTTSNTSERRRRRTRTRTLRMMRRARKASSAVRHDRRQAARRTRLPRQSEREPWKRGCLRRLCRAAYMAPTTELYRQRGSRGIGVSICYTARDRQCGSPWHTL